MGGNRRSYFFDRVDDVVGVDALVGVVEVDGLFGRGNDGDGGNGLGNVVCVFGNGGNGCGVIVLVCGVVVLVCGFVVLACGFIGWLSDRFIGWLTCGVIDLTDGLM